MENYERRLPVYLLLDCSESMVGEGIDGVGRGVRQVLLDLHSDPHALETVWLSIITFDSQAEQIVPLTELSQIRAPKLKVRPGTNLGGALQLLSESIKREVRTHSAESKGDWKPLVFLLTDGAPTGEWETQAAALMKPTASGSKPLNMIVIGCGEDVDPLVLMKLSDNVLMMGDKPGDFRNLFAWISSSLSATSQQIAAPKASEAVSLAKMPAGVFSAPQTRPLREASALPSQLFIAIRCSNTKKPYLTRYLLNDGRYYHASRTHIVEEDYFSGQREAGSDANVNISSGHLIGVLPCPHCHNPAAGQCPCGQIFCAPPDDSPVECPGCLRILGFGGESEFSLSGRMG